MGHQHHWHKYKNRSFLKKHTFAILVGVVIIAVFILAYGKDIFSSLGNISLMGSSNTIQNILETPQNYLNKQLEVGGEVYSSDGNYYVRNPQGYKLELQDCTTNRDLVMGEKTTFRGYILDKDDPVFFCGIYNSTAYYQKIADIQAQKRLQEIQTQQQIKQRQEQIATENRRKEIESDFKLRLAKINKGMSQGEVENILGLNAANCQYKYTVPDAENECSYSSVVENKYRVSFMIYYIDNGSIVTQDFSVITI